MCLICRFFKVNSTERFDSGKELGPSPLISSSFLFYFIQNRLWRSVKNSYILIITPSVKSRSSHGNEPLPFILMRYTQSYPGLGMTGNPVE